MRRHLDKYYTPKWAVEELLRHVKIEGRVFEPCAGTGQIASMFKDCITNDITNGYDATQKQVWELVNDMCQWTVTNPPFNQAQKILERALETNMKIAFLLRLSFLEPTLSRRKLLSKYPPSKIIVLPRISFTEDGRTDSVTCAWMIWWYKDDSPIVVVGG